MTNNCWCLGMSSFWPWACTVMCISGHLDFWVFNGTSCLKNAMYTRTLNIKQHSVGRKCVCACRKAFRGTCIYELTQKIHFFLCMSFLNYPLYLSAFRQGPQSRKYFCQPSAGQYNVLCRTFCVQLHGAGSITYSLELVIGTAKVCRTWVAYFAITVWILAYILKRLLTGHFQAWHGLLG